MAVLAWSYASGQDATTNSATGDSLLYPARISITGHFEAPLRPTALDFAIRSIGERIEQKRATDAANSQTQPLWDASFWRYLPADADRTMNSRVVSDDDAFFTPEYLKVSGRQLELQMKLSEKEGVKLFER